MLPAKKNIIIYFIPFSQNIPNVVWSRKNLSIYFESYKDKTTLLARKLAHWLNLHDKKLGLKKAFFHWN